MEDGRAGHLSLAQLHAELARSEEACRFRREEAASCWCHAAGRKLRAQRTLPVDAALRALDAVQSEPGLRGALQQQCVAAARAEERRRRLQEELRAAEKDAEKVTSGLPQLLAARCAELACQDARLAQLSQFEVDELRGQAARAEAQLAALHGRSGRWPSVRAAEAEHVERRSAETQCARQRSLGALQEAQQLQAFQAGRQVQCRRLQEAVGRLEAEALRLQEALQQREEQLAGGRLAQQLELNTLRRSLQLRAAQLGAKTREAVWLRRQGRRDGPVRANEATRKKLCGRVERLCQGRLPMTLFWLLSRIMTS